MASPNPRRWKARPFTRTTLLALIFLLPMLLAACLKGLSIQLPGFPTPTPSITLTPTLVPTPTPTLTPTPTPTPMPSVRIQHGDHALWEGDYDQALLEYKIVRDTSSDVALKAAALLGIGKVAYLSQDYPQALDSLRSVVEQYPQSDAAGAASFYLGQIYDALQRYPEAAAAYAAYLTARPGRIDAFVNELEGNAWNHAGDYPKAIQAFQTAQNAPHLGDSDNVRLEAKIALAYAAQGDWTTAINKYGAIYNATNNDYTKAEMDLYLGQAYLSLGEPDKAHTHFLDAVNNYPRSYDSYQALVALVDANVPVNDLNRGIVDYFAGQYAVALAAFDRYLNSTPDHDGTAHHYKAYTLVDMGNYEGAITEWRSLISDHKNDRFWSAAWDEIAYTYGYYLNDFTKAAQTYLDFVAAAPQDAMAPEALFTAARNYEKAGNLAEAVSTWERVGKEYPNSDQAYPALFQVGITEYRQAHWEAAQSAFQRSLVLATNPTDQSSAYYWTGKAKNALKDAAGASESWQQAALRDPTGYYSERARDMLLNRSPFEPPKAFDFGVDLEAERTEAESWLRKTFNLPDQTDLQGLGQMESDPRMVRAREFWNLGLWQNARSELEDLRQEMSKDPASTFRLIQYFRDLGLYRSAALASRQVLTLAGLDDAATLTAPVYFNHIRFGVYFQDEVLSTAKAEGFQPLFLLSVIRQESLFEGFVQSSAGARGLMQIVPTTGKEIADSLGWPPDYRDDDLYRPLVSIRLGAHYLARQRDSLNSDLYAALAAYNGGPGNALVWQELSLGDPDLFVEIVRFGETRTYIKSIYEIYNIYRRLYSREQ